MSFDRTSYLFNVGTGGTVGFDSVMKQSQAGSNKITTHAIENGAVVADHSEDSGGSLSLDIVLSDDNLSPVSPSTWLSDPVSVRLTTLEKWRKDGSLLTYNSPRKIITSLLIESVTANISQTHGWGVGYSIKLKQIRLYGTTLRDVNLPTGALRLIQKGLTQAVIQSSKTLIKSDIGL